MPSGATGVEDGGTCPGNVAKKGGVLLAENLATCVQTVLLSEVRSHPAEAEEKGAFKLKRGRHTGPQAAPQDLQQIGQEVHVEKGQVSSDIPQAGTATSEDKEVRRLSTEDSAEDRELEQLLSAQELMVNITDEVMVMGDAQPAGNPKASSDSGRPQIRQFSWSPNQALTMMVPVWIGRRQVMAVVDTAAQVIIMSRALSEELGCEAPVEKVQLRYAQQDSWMDGGIHEHFGFQLGGKKYYWDVVEADIGDSFIIGIDFLKSVKCKIDPDGNKFE